MSDAFTLIRPAATFSFREKELNGTRLAKLPLPAGEGGVRESADVFRSVNCRGLFVAAFFLISAAQGLAFADFAEVWRGD